MRRGYTAERYLDAARRRPGRDPRPRGHHRPHRRASPVRPTRTSSARSRSSTPRATTPRTRSCSRPAPAPRRPRWSTTSCPPRSCGSASPGSRRSSTAHAERAPRGAGRAGRGDPGRGPVEEGPGRAVGPHPPEQARPRRRRPTGDAAHVRARSPTCASPPPPTTGCAVSSLEVTAPAAAAPHPHPGHRGVGHHGPVTHLALVGPTASGKSALGLAVARGARRRRDRLDRLDAGLPGHGHRHRQAVGRPSGPRCRTT